VFGQRILRAVDDPQRSLILPLRHVVLDGRLRGLPLKYVEKQMPESAKLQGWIDIAERWDWESSRPPLAGGGK
jgi:hypothetical protein